MSRVVNSLKVQFVILMVLLQGTLQANWNNEFDEQTNRLIDELPQLQNEDYHKKMKSFMNARHRLLDDEDLCARVRSAHALDKFLVIRDDLHLILKKRKNDRMHDLYPWEISYLFNSIDYVVPSFAFEMEDKKVVIQRLEKFKFGEEHGDLFVKKGHSPKVIDSVSLITYWEAHIQAYILGLTDMGAKNIGVGHAGIIRFFDNEGSLKYHNAISSDGNSMHGGFMCQSFDWPQFREKLDSETAEHLRMYLEGFIGLNEKVKTYSNLRHIYDFDEEGLAERLEKLLSFEIKEGVSFWDFYGSVYPSIFHGMDELKEIASEILDTEVSDGSALFFICKWIHSRHLSHSEKAKVHKWLHKYID